MMGDRFVSLHLRFALNSLWCDLERPGKRQRNREPNHKNKDDNLHRPLRSIECGKENRCRLNREPRDYRVSDRDFVNVAPLQLGKEFFQVHRRSLELTITLQSRTRFWKRALRSADRRARDQDTARL